MNLAPNGKPSNLTPEQYKLVRTKAFKKWFGDWENDPKNSSKVVDENGEPLVCYHGSEYLFNEFKDIYENERGFFFSNKYNIALKFSEGNHSGVKPFFLNIRKIYHLKSESPSSWTDVSLDNMSNKDRWDLIKMTKDVFDAKTLKEYYKQEDEFGESDPISTDEFSYWARNKGYNGMVLDNILEYSNESEPSTSYIVYNPNQIKLADGSNTTFDSSNNDIRFDEGGLVGDVFTKKVYIIRLSGGDWFEDYNSVYDKYEDALNDYNKINNSDFERYENSKGLVKTLSEKTLKYKFVAEIDEDDNIDDYTDTITLKNEKIWQIIDDGEWNDLEADSVERVNEKADKLLSEVYNYYGRKYNTIYLDEDETISLKLRIADHSGKWKNKGSEDYFLSIVISDKNPTEDFYMNSSEGLNREQEEVFNSENTFEEIIEFINEKIEYYKEKSNILFDDGGLVAPNGKQSNLTAEQYKLVRTKAFKEWFGDWENDPKKASKVIDENGEPLVVYHGSKSKDIVQFNKGENYTSGSGIYFTNSLDGAKSYSRNPTIYSVFLNIRNPNIKNAEGRTWDNVSGGISIWDIVEESEKNNYNGVIVKNVVDSGGYTQFLLPPQDDYIVYDSTQIKLADGTNTTFDSNNNDIRFDDGGNVNKLKTLSSKEKYKTTTDRLANKIVIKVATR